MCSIHMKYVGGKLLGMVSWSFINNFNCRIFSTLHLFQLHLSCDDEMTILDTYKIWLVALKNNVVITFFTSSKKCPNNTTEPNGYV